MSWLYPRLIRPWLFSFDSEEIHERALRGLRSVANSPILTEVAAAFFGADPLPTTQFGLRFPNPIGLAAGMDKHATAVPAWAALGFGFCELGGVTWHPQDGNPRPRIFRVPQSGGLINSMGFNNPGALAAAQALQRWHALGLWPAHPVGINLGKSKDTPLEQAAEDYRQSFTALWPEADFFVVNVSSPNTPQLRELQNKEPLREILTALGEANRALATRRSSSSIGQSAPAGPSPAPAATPQPKPLLVKVAPDLDFNALDEILALAADSGIHGIVATNTTTARPPAADPVTQTLFDRPGGLSGQPLRQRSTEIIRHIWTQTRGRLPIVGVGGVFNAEDAWEKIAAGASLLQVYTGLVYQGPSLARDIVRGLREQLDCHGFRTLHEAVGSAADYAAESATRSAPSH